ncbi:unnamed protein product [Amoebophrya sp. A25]|nr:unnamed protein product [Amoebophrya sp. A25]|eukprot:GSA25T00006061001.1
MTSAYESALGWRFYHNFLGPGIEELSICLNNLNHRSTKIYSRYHRSQKPKFGKSTGTDTIPKLMR